MKFQRPHRRDVSIEITPLIDVVFLLLIFFMVTSTTMRENILSIVLPEAQGEVSVRASDDLEIVVLQSGFVQINEVRLDTPTRASIVSHIRTTYPNFLDARVVLGGDADARHAMIVMVLDALAELGVDDVSILVRKAIPE